MKIKVYKRLLNSGMSFGLQYPYLYGQIIEPFWWIWHRRTGEVVWVSEGKYEEYEKGLAMRKCLELNGLSR